VLSMTDELEMAKKLVMEEVKVFSVKRTDYKA
jgi:hypothetical protein